MRLHGHARPSLHGRTLLVGRVVDEVLPLEKAGHAAGVSIRTAYKWLRRFRGEGLDLHLFARLDDVREAAHL